MSRKVSFLLPDGRAVSRNQTVEAQKVIADEKNILVVEVQHITQEMPLYGLYKAKWQIAIIFDRARFTRLRVSFTQVLHKFYKLYTFLCKTSHAD